MKPTTLGAALTGVCMLASLAVPPVAAQDWSVLARDPEVQNHRLTLPQLRKLVEVQRTLNALAAKDPQAEVPINREFKALTKENPRPTVAQASAVIDRNASLRDVFSTSGVTSRDWLLTSSAMMNAAVDMAVRKQNPTAPSTATTDARKANVALLEQNQAEWQKFQQEMAQLAPK
jgi:hypothetical protein